MTRWRPDWSADHQRRDLRLPVAAPHDSRGPASCVQMRGEYLFVAEGPGGFRVYDMASVSNKGVPQKLVTAPFSPLGHNTAVPSANATCMALPTNQPIAPLRNQGDLMRIDNQEQPFHPIYSYAVVTDAVEGLILVDVNTLADGDPLNNFLIRAVTWNENKVLAGAQPHYARRPLCAWKADYVVQANPEETKARIEGYVRVANGSGEDFVNTEVRLLVGTVNLLEAIADLARRAQEGRLLPEELSGGTFTVNNFGADGNLIGTPVLNQPEVGILGVGTIGKRVVVVSQGSEDTLAIRWMGYLCLSYDHRAVDGAVAGRFLQRLRRSLESFTPGEGIWSDPSLRG